jgi:hypothetical protein
MERTWLSIVKNLAHHPRTKIVYVPSGCSVLPEKYTRLQRSFLDVVEAARHLRTNRRFKFYKRSQHLIRTHNETLSVAATPRNRF